MNFFSKDNANNGKQPQEKLWELFPMKTEQPTPEQPINEARN